MKSSVRQMIAVADYGEDSCPTTLALFILLFNSSCPFHPQVRNGGILLFSAMYDTLVMYSTLDMSITPNQITHSSLNKNHVKTHICILYILDESKAVLIKQMKKRRRNLKKSNKKHRKSDHNTRKTVKRHKTLF